MWDSASMINISPASIIKQAATTVSIYFIHLWKELGAQRGWPSLLPRPSASSPRLPWWRRCPASSWRSSGPGQRSRGSSYWSRPAGPSSRGWGTKGSGSWRRPSPAAWCRGPRRSGLRRKQTDPPGEKSRKKQENITNHTLVKTFLYVFHHLIWPR